MKFCNILLLLLLGNCIFSLDIKGSTWGPEKGGRGFYLKFKTEKDFLFEFSGEGGGQNVLGTYMLSRNEITLNIVTINDWGDLPGYIKQKTVKCSINETNSLYSKFKLVGNGGLELWHSDFRPKNGEKCILDGHVVYAYPSKGKVNDNARIREGPGLQYKYYTFSFEDEPEIYNVLPKGNSVIILGYSENKTIVDGVEHPWYYCVFRKNMWEEQYCWIWGGLIDF